VLGSEGMDQSGKVVDPGSSMDLEREKGLEPSTSCLGSKHSAN
jgi:hypothetical protein